jgi:hypothetical protein
MNCWGFHARPLPLLESGLRAFLAERGSDPKAEWYIPVAVSDLISGGAASVEVLPGRDSWFGITYREDRARVSEAIGALVGAGAYPRRLFG